MPDDSCTGTYGENMAGCMLWIPKFGSLILGIFCRLGRIYSDLKNRDVEYLSVEMGLVDRIDREIQELISAIEKQKATSSLQPTAIIRALLLQSFLSLKSMKRKLIRIPVLWNGTKIQEGLIFNMTLVQTGSGLRRTAMRISMGTSENDDFLSFLKSSN